MTPPRPPAAADDIVARLYHQSGMAERVGRHVRAALYQEAAAEIAALRRRVAELEARKDGAYDERNKVVAGLAALAIKQGYRAGRTRTAIEGWSDDWHGCVYIDLPSGQVSWHYHDSHAPLFAWLPSYDGKWDGHDTPTKYERVAALTGATKP